MSLYSKSLLVNSILFFLVISSCSEGGKEGVPNIPPVKFSFTDPVAEKTYAPNDTLFIDGTISWVKELHGYELTLTNMNTDSVVYSSRGHEHGEKDVSPIHIHKMWVNRLDQDSDIKLSVDAYKSHYGEIESYHFIFHCRAI